MLVTALAMLPSGCGQAKNTPTPPRAASLADGVLAVFERSGGLQGNLRRIELHSDGTANATGVEDSVSFKTPAPLVSELEHLLGSEDWRSLDEGYGGAPQRDLFGYAITGGGKRVIALEKTARPPVLLEAINHAETLIHLEGCAQTSASRASMVRPGTKRGTDGAGGTVAMHTRECRAGTPDTAVVYADGTVRLLLHGDTDGQLLQDGARAGGAGRQPEGHPGN